MLWWRRGAGDGDGTPVVRVDGPQLAVVDHGVQYAGVQQLGLLDDARDHLLGGGLELGLDEAHDGEVAFDFDVVAEIETIAGGTEGTQTDLELLGWFDARLVAGDAVFILEVGIHGRIDVCL